MRTMLRKVRIVESSNRLLFDVPLHAWGQSYSLGCSRHTKSCNGGSCSVMVETVLFLFPRGCRQLSVTNPSAGIAFWDVFKIAKLDTFKIKPVVASELEGVSAQAQGSSKSIRVQHTTHSAGKMPSSFTSNSAKERKLLAYIADFQNVFEKLYPHR